MLVILAGGPADGLVLDLHPPTPRLEVPVFHRTGEEPATTPVSLTVTYYHRVTPTGMPEPLLYQFEAAHAGEEEAE